MMKPIYILHAPFVLGSGLRRFAWNEMYRQRGLPPRDFDRSKEEVHPIYLAPANLFERRACFILLLKRVIPIGSGTEITETGSIKEAGYIAFGDTVFRAYEGPGMGIIWWQSNWVMVAMPNPSDPDEYSLYVLKYPPSIFEEGCSEECPFLDGEGGMKGVPFVGVEDLPSHIENDWVHPHFLLRLINYRVVN